MVKKAQVAMEYFILTAFIMVGVSIIFAFSFLNYDQNMKIATANETLSKLGNAVDLVYIKGTGNNAFVSINLPNGLEGIEIIHKCAYPPPGQGTLAECKNASGGSAGYSDLNFSAIKMDVKLLGGTSSIIQETKAVIWEDIGEIASVAYSGSAYDVRVSWTDTGLIKLEKI